MRERGLLFYSCLEDMAHMRPPNPTGNGKPKGKGKTNKGNGLEGVGVKGLDGENWRGRSSGFVCQVVFCGGGSQMSAFAQEIKISEWVWAFIRSCLGHWEEGRLATGNPHIQGRKSRPENPTGLARL